MKKTIILSLILSAQAHATRSLSDFIDNFNKTKTYRRNSRKSQHFTLEANSPHNRKLQLLTYGKSYEHLIQIYTNMDNSAALKSKLAIKLLEHPDLDTKGLIQLLNVFEEDYSTHFFWPNIRTLIQQNGDEPYIEEIASYCYTLQTIIDHITHQVMPNLPELFDEKVLNKLTKIKEIMNKRRYDIGRPHLTPALSQESLEKLDLIIQSFPR